MIIDTLKKTGLPCCYSHFKKPQAPPYLVYVGRGMDSMTADDTLYWRENIYQVEYYFTKKDEEKEKVIEDLLLLDGYLFSKSEDIYLESDDVFLIYYYTNGGKNHA